MLLECLLEVCWIGLSALLLLLLRPPLLLTVLEVLVVSLVVLN